MAISPLVSKQSPPLSESPCPRQSPQPIDSAQHVITAQKVATIALPVSRENSYEPTALKIPSSIQPVIQEAFIQQWSTSYPISTGYAAALHDQNNITSNLDINTATIARATLQSQPSLNDASRNSYPQNYRTLSAPYDPSSLERLRAQNRSYGLSAPYSYPQNDQSYLPQYNSQRNRSYGPSTPYSYSQNDQSYLPQYNSQPDRSYRESFPYHSTNPHNQYNDRLLFPSTMPHHPNHQPSLDKHNHSYDQRSLYEHNNQFQNSGLYEGSIYQNPITHQNTNRNSLSRTAHTTDYLWNQHGANSLENFNDHSYPVKKRQGTKKTTVPTNTERKKSVKWDPEGDTRTMIALIPRLKSVNTTTRMTILRETFPNRTDPALKTKYSTLLKRYPNGLSFSLPSTSDSVRLQSPEHPYPYSLNLLSEAIDLNSLNQQESNEINQTETDNTSTLSDSSEPLPNVAIEWTTEELKVIEVVETLRPLLSAIGVVKSSEFDSDPMFTEIVETALKRTGSNHTFVDYTEKRDALLSQETLNSG